MELDPLKQALVTPAYIVGRILSDKNYMFTESLLTSVGKKSRKVQGTNLQAWGESCFQRQGPLCVWYHTQAHSRGCSGRGGMKHQDPSLHEGKRFTSLYGVPWPLCVVLSDTFQQWCNGHRFNLKAECPFKLRTMACFQKTRTGGSITQTREGYNIAGSVFCEFFHMFLHWHWDI
jgi:hypothetical protein